MFPYLKPRFFSQYKEGGFIVGKFVASNSGATFTPVTSSVAGSPESHPFLSMAGDTGQYVVTLLGGAKQLTVVSMHVSLMDLDDPADCRDAYVDEETGIDVTAGTIPITTVTKGGTAAEPTVTDLPDTSVFTICLYVSK